MGNTVTFTKAKIWRSDIQTEQGEFQAYSIGVSSKNPDGTYANAYLPVRFAKASEAPEKITNGTIADLEGFLSVRNKRDGKNEVQLIVMKYTADVEDSFEQLEEEIPF